MKSQESPESAGVLSLGRMNVTNFVIVTEICESSGGSTNQPTDPHSSFAIPGAMPQTWLNMTKDRNTKNEQISKAKTGRDCEERHTMSKARWMSGEVLPQGDSVSK